MALSKQVRDHQDGGLGTKEAVDRTVVKVQRLRRVAERLIDSDDGDERQHGHDLLRYLKDPTLSLEAALGIATVSGGRSWRRLEQQESLEAAIRSLDRWLDVSDSAPRIRAQSIQAAIRHYQNWDWKREDRGREGIMPSSYQGTLKEHLFGLCEAHRRLESLSKLDPDSRGAPALPPSESTIRRILNI